MEGAGEQAQASSCVGYYPFPTAPELEEHVQAIRAKIESAGIRPLPFSVADVNEMGLTTRIFFKYARAFTNIANIKDEAHRTQILAAAVEADVIADVLRVTLREFFNLCKWLKSAAGRDTLQTVARRMKLARKLRASGDPVSLGCASSLMPSDYWSRVKKARATFEGERGVALRRLNEKFFQAGEHEEPSRDDVGQEENEPASSVAMVSERPGHDEEDGGTEKTAATRRRATVI